MITKVFWNRCL